MQRWLVSVVTVSGLAFGQVPVATGAAAAPPPNAAPAGSAVSAGPSAGQAWSVVGARTAGEGKNAIEIGVGFPAVSGAFLHGVTPVFDLGVRAGFTYGVEGMINAVLPGIKVNALVKLKVVDTGRFSLAVVAEPGPLLSFQNNFYMVGLSLPVGVHAGFAPASAISIGITFDLPFWINFGNVRLLYNGAYVPILTGLGVEYFVKSDLALFFRVKMGPTLSPFGTANFALDATMGLGWKM